MDEVTRQALLEVNRRFYERHAASFSATRERPWPGWTRLLEHLEEPAGGRLRVLDLGCGNGRFASFLAAQHDRRVAYLGVDGSASLLEAARRRLEGLAGRDRMDVRLIELDLTGEELARRLGATRFHLITLFGVLHHVPGRAERAGLLTRLAGHLDAPGVLTASLWLFDRRRRQSTKILPWDEYNRGAPEPIAAAQLERGDHLLTWAGDRRVPRYCHLVDDDEIAELEAAAGVPLRARFLADGPGGDHNLYLVFGAAPRPPLC